MSIRVFLEDLSIWVSRLRDKTHPHQSGRPHPLLRAQVEQRRGGRVNSLSLSLSPWAGTPISSCASTSEPSSWDFVLAVEVTLSAPLVLGSSDLSWSLSLAFLFPQLADGISGHVSPSIIMLTSCQNAFFYLSLYMLLVLFLWRTLL